MSANTFKYIVKNLLLQLDAYPRALLNRRQLPHQFVLFFRPRTGSNLLCDLANAHQAIFCDGEVFEGRLRRFWFPRLYLKGRSTKSGKTAYGFKLNINQIRLQGLHPKPFLTELHDKGWKIVYMQRQNLLQQAISFYVAQARDTWLDKSSDALAGFTFKVDCEALVAKMQRLEKAIQEEEALLEGIPHLKLVYEEDLLKQENHQHTLDQLLGYLGLESVAAQATLKKTASRKLSDYIENYQEMTEVLSKTAYASFLKTLDD